MGLWSVMRRKWLEATPPPGIDHLCPHLLRDIGLGEGEARPAAADPIRHRNYLDGRTFSLLHGSR